MSKIQQNGMMRQSLGKARDSESWSADVAHEMIKETVETVALRYIPGTKIVPVSELDADLMSAFRSRSLVLVRNACRRYYARSEAARSAQ